MAKLKKFFKLFLVVIVTVSITSCGFHPRGPITLAPKLYKLHLQTNNPYGPLTRNLENYLKASNVTIVKNPKDSTAILYILHETKSQTLIGISGTQQTRQYNLILKAAFQVTDPSGKILVPPQPVTESRTLTIKADQILAGSNEANSLYRQMQQSISYNIMLKLGSVNMTKLIDSDGNDKP